MYQSMFNSFPVIRTASAKNRRTAAHIFVSPGDAPAIITQYVAWMERQFNACQTPRSIYLSIFNSFRVIRCLSQCVSPKIAIFYHIFVSPGDAPRAITLNVVWMEREFDAYKLSRCMCPSNYYRFWDTARYLWKIILSYPLHSTPPLGGFPSEYRHQLWDGKTRMVSLPDGEKNSKICLFVLTWSTNVTDRRTDTGWQQRPCISFMHGIARQKLEWWLLDDEQKLKLRLLVLIQCTNVTDSKMDRQTPRDDIGGAYA